MKFAKVKESDASLSELVSRLYDIRGPKSKERAEEAEAALLRANPHLKSLKSLSEAGVIVVPDVAGIKSSEEFKPIESFIAERLDDVRQALGGIRERLESSVARSTEEAKNTLEILTNRKVKAQAKKAPAVKEILSNVAKENKDRLKEAKNLSAFHNEAMKQLETNLEDFANRIVKREA